MQTHTKSAIGLLLAGFVIVLGYKFLLPMFEDSAQRESSDARATKGKLVVGVDNWIGYFPLCSPEMRKNLRRVGYILQCQDDSADYATRMKALRSGDLQFSVATIDSYLVNGYQHDYPGTIVSVIDESKGGDAIVGWEDKVKNLDALKSNSDYRIAFTPNSPSEHLLKSMAVHFDVPNLLGGNKQWRVETDGSEAALKVFLKKDSEIAVLWEPDVSRALQNKGVVKLLGSEDTDKLIVDILIVNRKFSQKEPEAVTALLKQYYRTLKYYRNNPQKLIDDAAEETDLDKTVVKTMLNGVKWATLSSNSINWFGLSILGSTPSEGLVDAIDSTVNILVDHGDYSQSPLPDSDPYRIINSQFVADLFNANVSSTQFGQTKIRTLSETSGVSLERKFGKLSKTQWQELREIGTLKVRPIVFQSGVDELNVDSKEELDKAVENLKHYPNFRIVIKGHTGTCGDKVANQQLSQERSEAVARYFNVTYGIDIDRMRPVGLGASQPLQRKSGESNRAYSYRLPRVELFLVTEDL